MTNIDLVELLLYFVLFAISYMFSRVNVSSGGSDYRYRLLSLVIVLASWTCIIALIIGGGLS